MKKQKPRAERKRLRRPCKGGCGRYFIPTGRECWICPDCQKKRIEDRRREWKIKKLEK